MIVTLSDPDASRDHTYRIEAETSEEAAVRAAARACEEDVNLAGSFYTLTLGDLEKAEPDPINPAFVAVVARWAVVYDDQGESLLVNHDLLDAIADEVLA